MQHFTSQLETVGDLKKILRQSCKNNRLPVNLAGSMTVLRLKLLQNKLQHSPLHSFSWQENEMKAFGWILIAISAMQNLPICRFKEEQLRTLEEIFSTKEPSFLKYELTRFLKQRLITNRKWETREDQQLIRIVQRHSTKGSEIHWNEVARALFTQSNEEHFRLPKHCRQHWLNHLDPSKERGEWKNSEDCLLLQEVLDRGKKWSKIGRVLNRTEHMVKNRFNSLMLRHQSPSADAQGQRQAICRELDQILSQIQSEKRKQREPEQIQEQEKPKNLEPLVLNNVELHKSQTPVLKNGESQKSGVARQNSDLSLEGLDGMEEFQRYMKEGDPNSPQKHELKLLVSPYVNFSPMNYTPGLMGSPSPLYSFGYSSATHFNSFSNCSRIFTNELKKKTTEQ